MTGLLVSVRDAAEAADALAGGADLIDVKEPNAGSLGAAGHPTLCCGSGLCEVVVCKTRTRRLRICDGLGSKVAIGAAMVSCFNDSRRSGLRGLEDR
jgi:uncharacterized protein (UPF0264 family)